MPAKSQRFDMGVLAWCGFAHCLVAMCGCHARHDCSPALAAIGQSLVNYRDAEGTFPPPSIVDRAGRPIHSWRTLLVPFLEKNAFADHYDFEVPWDDPANRHLHTKYYEAYMRQMRDITLVHQRYKCCGREHSGRLYSSNLLMVVDSTKSPADIALRSGTKYAAKGWKATRAWDDRVVVIVVCPSMNIHWMEPRDVTTGEVRALLNGSASAGEPKIEGALVIERDNSFETLSAKEAVAWLAQHIR